MMKRAHEELRPLLTCTRSAGSRMIEIQISPMVEALTQSAGECGAAPRSQAKMVMVIVQKVDICERHFAT